MQLYDERVKSTYTNGSVLTCTGLEELPRASTGMYKSMHKEVSEPFIFLYLGTVLCTSSSTGQEKHN